MNEKQFRINVIIVISIYLFAIVAGVSLKVSFPEKDDPIYDTFSDLVPFAIAIPAAWLSFCFQRRQAYLKDIRELWSKLVNATQDAIQYTHVANPSQTEFAMVQKSLSTAIEELRAVFLNLGLNEEGIGLFPFESIKDIQKSISTLGFNASMTPNQQRDTRTEIVSKWKKLREHFLSEFARGVPIRPDSPFLN